MEETIPKSSIEKTEDIKERYYCIDLMKAIAIFMVLIYHNKFLNINIVNDKEIFTYINYFITSILSCCVPIFFFVNGALLLNKKLDIKKHIKKIIKIIIITEIWAVLTLIIMMFAKEQFLTIKEFFKSMWEWKHMWINHLWFLPALVVVYIFFPIIKSAYDNNKSYFIFFLIIAFICTFGNKLLYIIINIIHPNFLGGEKNLLNNYNAFRGIYGYTLVYFMLGGLLFKFKEKFNKKNIKRIVIPILFLNMLLLTIYGIYQSNMIKKVYDTVWSGYDTIFTLFNVVIIFILSLSYKNVDDLFGRLIKMIAENSLGIYFLHWIISPFLKKIYLTLPFTNNIITSIGYAVILLCVSLAVCIFLKKVPLIKQLFKI